MPARLSSLQPAARIRKRVQRLVTTLQTLVALPDPGATDIHQLRRSTKKLRAWLKLRRGPGGIPGAKHIERLLRENAARFAGARDATVRLQTLDQLPTLAGDKAVAATSLARCHALFASIMPSPTVAPDALAAQQLDATLRQLLSAEAVPEPVDTLVTALRRSYRNARKRLQQARASGAADDLHRFRRWAKYLCYQLELVCVLERGALAKLHRSLDTLGARLGTWHDLVVLEAQLRALHEPADIDPAVAAELGVAEALCQRAQRRLLARCLRIAASCFKNKPAQFPVK